MKRITTLLVILCLSASALAGQPTTTKTNGTIKIGVTTVPDTTKVYTGARGSKYFWKMSGKSGKPYKHYLPK